MTAPGPRKLAAIAGIPQFSRNQIGRFRFGWKTYGDLYQVEIARRDIWVCSHPDQAKQVLVDGRDVWHRIERTMRGRPFGLRLALGDGLLTTDGSDWQWRRHMINPAFHRERVNDMVKTMIEAGEEMVTRFHKVATAGEAIDLHVEMKRVTQDVITRTMFSADVEHEGGKVGHAVDEALVYVAKRSRSLLDLPSLPTPSRARFNKAMRDIDDALYRSIRHRRESGSHGDDLLGILLTATDEETGQPLDDQQIRNEIATIFGAGHDTTANALTWAWHELMQSPPMMERLGAEVDESQLEVGSLKYTRMVLEETLRFRPPVPINGRRALEPTRLGDYKTAKDAIALLVVSNIHRHPEFWDRPDTFDPDRFSPGAEADRNRYAYLPFGAGPHMCIGSNFAMMEAVLLLAMMAKAFTFRPATDLPRKQTTAVTMKPAGGLPVYVDVR